MIYFLHLGLEQLKWLELAFHARTGFSEKSFFQEKNLKYGRSMGSDATPLNFSKELDSMRVLERLDF